MTTLLILLSLITGFVTDSTSSLIPNAVISSRIGHVSDTTKWDGQFAVPAPRWYRYYRVSAEGYHTQTIRVSAKDTLAPVWVTLRPKAVRSTGRNGISLAGGRKYTLAGSDAVMYKTMRGVESAVMADMSFAVATESVADAVMPLPSFPHTNSPAPEAGKLTAGEVNDFARWELWTKVYKGSHAQYMQDWKMLLSERYTLQVVNTTGYPMADIYVTLTDAQGHTLYQARTDNTGKAELWNGMTGPVVEGPLYFMAEGQRSEALPNTNRTTIVLDEPCSRPETTDVFFIIDATGSMMDELRYLNAELQDVIARSEHAVEGLTIRTGALVYRDHGDEYLTRISRLTDKISTTQDFLSKQEANGGGDYEEAIPEALMAALSAADWSDEARARIAFLVLDAPCHKDSATLALLHEQIRVAASMGVRIVPVVCSGLRESGELLLRQMALATNGTSFFLTDDSGIGGTHLKPTTDSLKVEHLNDMLVRTIISFSRMPECQATDGDIEMDDIEAFIPNPFDAADVDSIPTSIPAYSVSDVVRVRPNPCSDYCVVDLPMGADAMYLCDIAGKTVMTLGRQQAGQKNLQTASLSTGVYFVKVWLSGRWYTVKVLKV